MKKLFMFLMMALPMMFISCAEEDEQDVALATQLVGQFNDNSVVSYDFWLDGEFNSFNGFGVINIELDNENVVKLSGYIKASGKVLNNHLYLEPQHNKLGFVTYDTVFDPVDLSNINEIEMIQTITGTGEGDKPFKTIVKHKLVRI